VADTVIHVSNSPETRLKLQEQKPINQSKEAVALRMGADTALARSSLTARSECAAGDPVANENKGVTKPEKRRNRILIPTRNTMRIISG
jgi:hypothetical protein